MDLYNNSFAGFRTNRLFNGVPPDLVIWDNCYSRLLSAKNYIKAMDVAHASKQLQLARLWYLYALKKYSTWKDGIEGAGTKMQIAIGVTALALIVAAVAAYAATAAAATGATATAATGSTAAVEQTLARIAASCANAERVIAAANEEMRMLEAIEEAERVAAALP